MTAIIQPGSSIIPRKTGVRDTSLEAYRSAKVSKGQQRVLDFLRKYPGRDWTRNELATMSGIPINVICPRVLELIIAGELDERHVKRACRFSGKQAYCVRLAPKQLELVA